VIDVLSRTIAEYGIGNGSILALQARPPPAPRPSSSAAQRLARAGNLQLKSCGGCAQDVSIYKHDSLRGTKNHPFA
jgi:hypothetical protein